MGPSIATNRDPSNTFDADAVEQLGIMPAGGPNLRVQGS